LDDALLSHDRALAQLGGAPAVRLCAATLRAAERWPEGARSVGAANAGAAVVALSRVFDSSALAAAKRGLWRWRMPTAARKATQVRGADSPEQSQRSSDAAWAQVVLSDVPLQAGRCVALDGGAGWLLIRLPRPALLHAASFEHAPRVDADASRCAAAATVRSRSPPASASLRHVALQCAEACGGARCVQRRSNAARK